MGRDGGAVTTPHCWQVWCAHMSTASGAPLLARCARSCCTHRTALSRNAAHRLRCGMTHVSRSA